MKIICDKQTDVKDVLKGTMYVNTLNDLYKILHNNYKQIIDIHFTPSFITEEFQNNKFYIRDFIDFANKVFPNVKFDEDYGVGIQATKDIANKLTKVFDVSDLINIAYCSDGKFLRTLRMFAEVYEDILNNSAEQSHSILSLKDQINRLNSVIEQKDQQLNEANNKAQSLESYTVRITQRLNQKGWTKTVDNLENTPLKTNAKMIYIKVIEDSKYLTSFVKYLRLYLNSTGKTSRLIRLEPYNGTLTIKKYPELKYTNFTNRDVIFNDLLILGKNRDLLEYIASNGGNIDVVFVIDNSLDNVISFAGQNVKPIIYTNNYIPEEFANLKIITSMSEDYLNTNESFHNMDEISRLKYITSLPLAKEIIKSI